MNEACGAPDRFSMLLMAVLFDCHRSYPRFDQRGSSFSVINASVHFILHRHKNCLSSTLNYAFAMCGGKYSFCHY